MNDLLRKLLGFSLLIALASLLMGSGKTPAYVVSNYTLLSKVSAGGKNWDFTYRAKLTNNTASPASGVTATLIPPTTSKYSIVDGSLDFGDVAAKTSKASVDTFTIRRATKEAMNSGDLNSYLKWLIVTGGTPPPPVSVPNVVGMTQANATTAITAAGLVVGTVTTASSSTVPSGSVISQSPASGTSVNTGSAVNLVVSSGPAQVSVPNVVGMTQANATTAITAAGLVVGTISSATSGTVASGSVISQTPASGTSVNTGSAVNLVVSSGPAPVSVPNVVGMTQANATNAITSAGLVVGTVTTATSSTVASGSVISQTPAAGGSVNVGSAVNLVVSSGPAQVSVPNVVGMTQANATTAITSAGLVFGTITTASSSTVPSGSVISQTPAAGGSVNVGSAVNLVVSSGPAQVSVPDVVGMTQANATTAITSAGLIVGTVTNATSSTVVSGSVISQTPAAGSSATLGSAVNLVVSSGLGNTPPVANAGPNQTVFVGQLAQLTGVGSSDVDGNPLTYRWTLAATPTGSAATLTNPTAVNPTLTPDKPGSYQIQLIVNDGIIDSVPSTVTISTQNSAPVSHAGPNQSVVVTQTIQLDGTGSTDVDGDPLTYQWSLTAPVGSTAALSNATDPKPSFTADKPGAYVVQLIVGDGTFNSTPSTVTITTRNSPPVANAGPNQTGVVNQLIHLDGSASTDVDGDALTYTWSLLTWPTGSTASLTNPTAVNPSFTLDKAGVYVVQLIVNDGLFDSTPATMTVTTQNSPPVANAGTNQTVFVGQAVQLDGSTSTDVDGNQLAYLWSLTPATGSAATLSNPSLFNPTFSVDKPGSYVGQLIVNDGFVNSTPSTVTITTQNSPPVANAGPDQTVFTGSTVNLDGSATHDVDGDPLTYQWSLTSKPGASASSLQNATTINPGLNIDQPGSYVVQLIANDGLVDSAPDTVTISTQNSRPVANAGANQNGFIGQPASFDGSQSSDADHDPLTYTWSLLNKPTGSTAGLTAPTSVNPTLVPDAVGDYIAQLIVNDGQLDSVPPATTTLSVVNRAPVIGNATTVFDATEATPFSVQILANDPDGQLVSYSPITSPVGMTISASGLVSWPIPVYSALPVPFTVQVVDSLGATASQPFTINVAAALIAVPDVTGQTQALATQILGLAKLTTGAITSAYSNTVPTGSVISQLPIAATLVGLNTPVDLVVSLGPDPTSIAVPNLMGQGRNPAIAALQAIQLKAGVVTEQNSDTVPAGKVISQTPASGYVTAGTAVDLVVSVGPAAGGGIPPSAADVAPPLDSTVATNQFDATAFLYTGSHPIQTGVAPGTIQPQRVAVMRGRVLDRSNAPIPGVTISINNHPEFGQTLTQMDGQFDMVVNGGGELVVNYVKSGLLRVQRQVKTPWQDYVGVADVVMIPVDPAMTLVDLTAPGMKVARGSVQTDNSGSRQTTVLIPENTQASVYQNDGTLTPVNTLHVHVTEFTVGNDGPSTMPGNLPPTSAYTYAVEFTAEEAIAKFKGRDVEFSQPVMWYVENFRQFPVGYQVPLGFYDRDASTWLGEPDGRVIQIVSISNGSAELDTDGDGVIDNGAGLGISLAERQTLASLYSEGQTVQRFTMQHFSSGDGNSPYENVRALPGDDSTPPDNSDPKTPDEQEPEDPKKECNSIVNCEAQSFGEQVAVSGLPYGLHYESQRVPDRKTNYTLDIPWGGGCTGCWGFSVGVSVAGRSFVFASTNLLDAIKKGDVDIPNAVPGIRNATPLTSNPLRFTWDGKDAYGRVVQGPASVNVSVVNWYPLLYCTGTKQMSWGLACDSSAQYIWRNIAGVALPMVPVLGPVYGGFSTTSLGGWDGRMQGLGAWTLGVHHAYDPLGQTLWLGTGNKVAAQSSMVKLVTKKVVTGAYPLFAIAPDGSIYSAHANTAAQIIKRDPSGVVSVVAGDPNATARGDGGPAMLAQIRVSPYAGGLVIGPDESIYFIDVNAGNLGVTSVRKVSKDGIITTVADDNGEFISSGDGGPAVSAGVIPKSIAVAPDGTLYIAEPGRLRRVGPDGQINTIAGYGYGVGIIAYGALCPAPYATTCQDEGIPAVYASFNAASGGWARPLTIGTDGSIYYVESWNGFLTTQVVRKISPEGIVTTVAGGNRAVEERRWINRPYPDTYGGDGGLATDAIFSLISDIKVGADGSLFVLDAGNGRIRRIGTNGVVNTVAGTGPGANTTPMGTPAAAAQLGLTNNGPLFSLGLSPDGNTLYYSSHGPYGAYSYINALTTTLPGFTGITDFLVPSGDGGELYRFDYAGRHLTTTDTLTGKTTYSFGYDTGGKLISVTDVYGNVTAIQRDAAGNPTAIVGPYGQTTSLSLDANGFLSRITDPTGASYGMAYTPGGLMTSFTDPNGKSNTVTYDADGRLVTDANAAGGTLTLARTQLPDGYHSTVTTSLGRTTSHHFTYSLWTGQTDVHNYPDGTAVTEFMGSDGTRQTTYADGSVYRATQTPDSRFGMLAPVTSSGSLQTGGLTADFGSTRTINLSDPNNPLSLNARTDTSTVNGRTSTRSYDAATKTATLTSAAGRTLSVVLDAFGRPSTTQMPGLDAVSNTYDPRGRLTGITQGTGPTARSLGITYNPQGYPATVTDSLNRSVGYQYDAAGRVTTQTLPDGRQVLYTYDAKGNLTSLQPPGKPAHLFKYTGIDQTSDYDPPPVPGVAQAATTYSYDLDKALTQVTRPDGQAIVFNHDTAGRTASVVLQPANQTLASYGYDATTGKLTSRTASDGGVLSYAYNQSLLTGITATGTVSGALGFSYDNSFRVTGITVNGTDNMAYGYDNDDLLTSAGSLTLARNAQNGLLTGTTLGSLTDSRNYTGFGELSTYNASYGADGLLQEQYSYDQLGRITQKVETVQGQADTYAYGYDTAGRLISVTKNSVVQNTYSYDDNGNRLSRVAFGTPINGSYDDQDRLLSYGNNTYSYTANGELTAKTVGGSVTTGYQYDVLGNLRHVDLPGGTTLDYVIDGQTRRIGKKVNGTLVQGFLYQDQLKPIAELDANNAVISRFVYATHVNVPDYMVKGGVTYRIITDHLGSPRLVVNTVDGSIAQRMDFDEFGNVTSDSNPGFQPFGFAGGVYDRDTGLVRFGARDYDSEIGRWVSKDPIGFLSGDTNLFGYVMIDPINATDVLGLYDPSRRRNPRDDYTVGRPGTFVEPGKGIGAFIDDHVIGGHDLGVLHDKLVDSLTCNGVPDSIANIPTMVPVYVITNFANSSADIARDIESRQKKGESIKSTGDIVWPIITIEWNF